MNKGGIAMERGINSSMLSFDTVNIHTVESLFQSEGVFWLTTAVATGLAAEEVERFCAGTEKTVNPEQMIALFNQCIRNNEISAAELEQAKCWSMENLKQIDHWNRKTVIFQEQHSLGISKGFTAYWLNYKLIELEWQQVLGLKEIEGTYQFLDQVLADSEELEQIEYACQQGSVNEDQRLFLRSHWQRSRIFWNEFYTSLRLLALGMIELRHPKRIQDKTE